MKNRFTVLAPTRVDLAGGTLDLWPLYCLVGSAKTVNVALDLFAETRIETEPHYTFEIQVQSASGATATLSRPLSLTECRKLDPALRFPVCVLSSYLVTRPELPKMRIAVACHSRVPMGSGLGGSSTLGVSLLRGISRVFGDFSDLGWQWEMLAHIRDAEAAFLETPTGTQDYLAALFGSLSTFQSRPGKIDHLPHARSVVDALSERMLVLFSGEQHHSGKSNWEIYKGAIDKDRSVLKGISVLAETAESMDAELRAPGLDWQRVGKLLDQEWEVRRELFRVSTPRLDQLMSQLKKHSILGAKVCGAASGGSILVLVEPSKRTFLAGALERENIQVLNTKPSLQGVSIS
jgi:D-glycero-alpha-D-manno-heptose-7-phosphate kinase